MKDADIMKLWRDEGISAVKRELHIDGLQRFLFLAAMREIAITNYEAGIIEQEIRDRIAEEQKHGR